MSDVVYISGAIIWLLMAGWSFRKLEAPENLMMTAFFLCLFLSPFMFAATIAGREKQ